MAWDQNGDPLARAMRRPLAVQAAAAPVNISEERLIGRISHIRNAKWQKKTMHYYHSLAEVHAGAEFVNNTLSMLKMVPGRIEDDFRVVRSDDQLERTIVQTANSLDYGRSGAMLHLVGEFYLLGEPIDGVDEVYHWHSRSIFEYDKQKRAIVDRDGKVQRQIPSNWRVLRVWEPDLDFYEDADSAHRSMMDVMKVLVLRTEADSRSAASFITNAGLLALPDEGFQQEEDEGGPAAPDGTSHGLEKRLADNAMRSLEDNNSIAAALPIAVYGDKEQLEAIRLITLDRLDNAGALNEIIEMYRRRYATGVDLPAEVILGMSDMATGGHFAVWKVDSNIWQYHLAPRSWKIAMALTENWYRDALVANGVSPEEAATRILIPDAADVINRPDKTDTAIKLYDRLAIGGDALRREAGFPESDQPDEDELRFMLSTRRLQGGEAPEFLPTDETQVDENPDPDSESTQAAATPSKLDIFNESIALIEDALESKVQEVADREFRAALVSVVEQSRADFGPDVESFAFDASEEIALAEEHLADRLERLSAAAADAKARAIEEFTGEEVDDVWEGRDEVAAAAFISWFILLLNQRVNDLSAVEIEAILAGDTFKIDGDVPRFMVQGYLSSLAGGEHAISDGLGSLIGQHVAFNEDPITQFALNEAGFGPVYQWNRGLPEIPFPPHVALEGKTWRTEEERAELTVSSNAFPFPNHYPGDHKGCQCWISVRYEER